MGTGLLFRLGQSLSPTRLIEMVVWQRVLQEAVFKCPAERLLEASLGNHERPTPFAHPEPVEG